MAIISRQQIKDRVTNGTLGIEPFDEGRLEPASYDCLLGKVIAAGVGHVKWGEHEQFVVESNSWASVASAEQFQLPGDLCASYGVRSSLARRGLIAFGGPQIDPGYSGRIFVSLYNPTLEPIVLMRNTAFITVIFYEVSPRDEDGYSGQYQGQTDFPSEDVEFMMRMRSRNLADVIENVETLNTSVSDLSKNLKILTTDVHDIKKFMSDAKPWVKVVGWILGAAGVAMIGSFAANLINNLFG